MMLSFRMLSEREVVLYCDFHGHSRKMNVFMYGCENKDPTLRLLERVFPNMMSRNTSKVSNIGPTQVDKNAR